MVGASLEEVDEEAEVEEDVAFNMSKEGCFQIIGTLKNKTSPKPDFVKDIIEVNSFKISDVYLYNVSTLF